jgi:hypothetical protein
MLHRNGRAVLTASLLADRREQVVAQLCSARPSAPAPVTPLFPDKHFAARSAKRRPAALVLGLERTRLSLRLTHEQDWRLRVAAASVRQSCQAFLVDALDRHVARIVRDPPPGTLGALLASTPAPNG